MMSDWKTIEPGWSAWLPSDFVIKDLYKWLVHEIECNWPRTYFTNVFLIAIQIEIDGNFGLLSLQFYQ